MTSAEGTSQQVLQTNRPWLVVAGCLGGGFLGALLAAVLVAAVAVVLVFFPEVIPFGRRSGRTAFVQAVGELQKSPSLRVATREVAVRVDAVQAFRVPTGITEPVEIGRTTVEVFAPGNIVQYIVPLEEDGRAVHAVVDAEEDGPEDGAEDGAWTVTLPPPRVDTALVEVQSDPKKLRVEVDRDWADHVFGDDAARNEALSTIRAAVIREASGPTAMFEVREKSRAVVADMIRALLPAEHRGRAIAVRWTDDPADR